MIVGNYSLPCSDQPISELLEIGAAQRTQIELKEAARIASQLVADIPKTDAQRKKLLTSGTKLADKMGWDQVINNGLTKLLKKVVR
ncbi:MAG: hypothetical protein JKX85_00090 [Phycisphaeraceae bacterium]|nr:hypothetical protein [Phycisphaeraceae bacterium]